MGRVDLVVVDGVGGAVVGGPLGEQRVVAGGQRVAGARGVGLPGAVGGGVPADEGVAGALEAVGGHLDHLVGDALGGGHGALAAVGVVGQGVGVGRVVQVEHERAVAGHGAGGDRLHVVLVEEGLVGVARDRLGRGRHGGVGRRLEVLGVGQRRGGVGRVDLVVVDGVGGALGHELGIISGAIRPTAIGTSRRKSLILPNRLIAARFIVVPATEHVTGFRFRDGALCVVKIRVKIFMTGFDCAAR